jgi:hypothetical protein
MKDKRNLLAMQPTEVILFSPKFYVKLYSITAFLFFSIFLSSCSKEDVTTSKTTTTTSTTTTSSKTYYYQNGGTATLSGKVYYSTKSDTSAVEVTGGGTLTLSNSRIRSSANTSSTDSSSFYGLNAAVLATGGSTITLTNDSITTTGLSANGVYSYGTSTVNMSGDTIKCTANGAHGIYAAGGGTMTATNVIATTAGGSSSVIATDRGGGTITVTGGSYTAGGSNSAAIYSTGVITCSNTTLTATGAEALVIEGANYITLNNCTVKSTYNKWGSLIYQSMSGDASGTDGYLVMTGGSFTYTGTAGGMFYNTNSTANITLSGVALTNSCDTLVRCIKGSWGGATATSGGITNLTTSGQTMSGLIYVDANSTFSLTLKSSSAYTGRINTDNVAEKTSVTMDSTSTWILTGNTYLTSLTDGNTTYSNITPGNYHLYVNNIKVL